MSGKKLVAMIGIVGLIMSVIAFIKFGVVPGIMIISVCFVLALFVGLITLSAAPSKPKDYSDWDCYEGKITKVFGHYDSSPNGNHSWQVCDVYVKALVKDREMELWSRVRVPDEYWHEELEDHVVYDEILKSDVGRIYVKRGKLGVVKFDVDVRESLRFDARVVS